MIKPDMTEQLLPSEIARLVLGYLKTEGCDSSFNTFLKECPHLREYAMLLERGWKFTPKVNDHTLDEHLKEYCDLKKAVSTQSSLSHHVVSADGQLRRVVMDTPAVATTSKNAAFGSTFIINDASPGPYAKKEIPNPCIPKRKIDVEKKKQVPKERSTKRALKKRTSILEDAWKAASEKSGADLHFNSDENTKSDSEEVKRNSVAAASNRRTSTRTKSKNSVKKILFEGSEDDSCQECTKNQTEKSVRSKHSKQTWKSSVVSSKNKRSVPKVRLKVASSGQQTVISSDEDDMEVVEMDTGYDELDDDGDVCPADVDRVGNNSQIVGPCPPTWPTEENVCGIKQGVSSTKPSTSAESLSLLLPANPLPELLSKLTEPLTLEIPEVADEPPGLHTPLKNVDVQSMMSTPSKFNDTASVISVGRSPKRKSHAPKRRFNKPPAPRTAASHYANDESSLFTFPFPNDDPVSVDMSSIVQKLLEDTMLQEKLAKNINQGFESKPLLSSQRAPSEPCQQDATKGQETLDTCNFLGTKEGFVHNVNDETIGGIMEMTKGDPAFDALFSLFNVEKDNFSEGDSKQPATGLHQSHCDVNGNLKGSKSGDVVKDSSGDNTLLDRLDAMVTAANDVLEPMSDNQQIMNNQGALSTEAHETDAEVVYILNLPSPMSGKTPTVSKCVAYAGKDHCDNVVTYNVEIESTKENKTSVCGKNVHETSSCHSVHSSDKCDRSQSNIPNSDETVRHFSKEFMDLKSPYLSQTNSPTPVDTASNHSTSKLDQSNASMEYRADTEGQLTHTSPVGTKELVQQAQSLNDQGISPVNIGSGGDGPTSEANPQWKFEVIEMGTAPDNVECGEFNSVSFESEHSKSTNHNQTKDVAFTKPQTIGQSSKPRRVPLTTLSNVPSPATPNGDGQSFSHFGSSPVPSPFLQSPFSPQTPMMPRTPSYSVASPMQASFETSGRHFTNYAESPGTPSQSKVPEVLTKQIALSPAPSLYSRPSSSPHITRPCQSPQIQTRGCDTSRPYSPRTPFTIPPASPIEKNEESYLLSIAEADPNEILSMTAEFSPSKPITTSSPATPRSKPTSSRAPSVGTPEKTVAGMKATISQASQIRAGRLVATPDKISTASNKLLNMQRATPDKRLQSTPGKGETSCNYVTPNKGPPSVGSCRNTQSPYSALRMTPVQTTDNDYSQHQNLAVASIILTPRKASKPSSDNDEDISNESDESVTSVATVVCEEQRLAIDAILQPSPAKSTCATPRKLFFKSHETPVKSNSSSPSNSPHNFGQIVPKEPVVFKTPDCDKVGPSSLKPNEQENTGEEHGTCKDNNQSLVKESGVGLQVIESENPGSELTCNSFTHTDSNSKGVSSDNMLLSDQAHPLMMESLSSETISAFEAYAESIPIVEQTMVSNETTHINVTTNFGILPHDSSVTSSASQPIDSTALCHTANVVTSCSQEMTSVINQEPENENNLLAEVHETLASMPSVGNELTPSSTALGALSSQSEDIPLSAGALMGYSAGALMGYSAAQEQMYSTSVSESQKVFAKSPKYQQRGCKSKPKKSHQRNDSSDQVGMIPAPSYTVPIPRSINLQDPAVRVLQVKTLKGNVIPVFLTPFDINSEQSNTNQLIVSPPLEVIPGEEKDITSSEACTLIQHVQDTSQSIDTIFSDAVDLLSGQDNNVAHNDPKRNDRIDSEMHKLDSIRPRAPETVVSESSSVSTSPDMKQVKGGQTHLGGTVMEGAEELSKERNKRKWRMKDGNAAKKSRQDVAPVDDCDNVELLDFLQAHPVGDLCKKSSSSPYKSPTKTPAKVESYKFCSPAPRADDTRDASSMWHDIVNIDLGDQTKIMADITRPLSELMKTPSKNKVSRLHGTPSRSRHAATPTRHNTESNSSLTFSPSQGKLRPIVESCSIIDNHIVASPLMSLEPEPLEVGQTELDPDQFLQTLPEQVMSKDGSGDSTTQVNSETSVRHSTSLQPLVSSSTAMMVTATTTNTTSQNPTSRTSPIEMAAAESGILPSHSSQNGNLPTDLNQAICPIVQTLSVQPASMSGSANSHNLSVPLPTAGPASLATNSINLPSIQPTLPTQSNIMLVTLPDGRIAVLPTSTLLAPALTPAPKVPDPFVPKKRKYKQRIKKTPPKPKAKVPASDHKKRKTPAPTPAPAQNITPVPLANPFGQVPQILSLVQPGGSMTQQFIQQQQSQDQTLTLRSTFQQLCSTQQIASSNQPTYTPQPVPIGTHLVNSTIQPIQPMISAAQPVPTATQLVTTNWPMRGAAQPVPTMTPHTIVPHLPYESMTSAAQPLQTETQPTDTPTEFHLVIAETPPYSAEEEIQVKTKKISPGLEALIKLASPKKDAKTQPKHQKSRKSSKTTKKSSEHHTTESRKSESSPQKRTNTGPFSTFSPLVAAAVEYQEMKKKGLNTPVKDATMTDADVSMNMPSEEHFLGFESNEKSPVEKSAEETVISKKNSKASGAAKVPSSSVTLQRVSKKVKKETKSNRKSKKTKLDLTSPVLPPESVISNMRGSRSEVVLSIPNNATPTIDTEMFSALLGENSDLDSGKEGSRSQKEGKPKQKRRRSSNKKTSQVDKELTSAKLNISTNDSGKGSSSFEKDNVSTFNLDPKSGEISSPQKKDCPRKSVARLPALSPFKAALTAVTRDRSPRVKKAVAAAQATKPRDSTNSNAEGSTIEKSHEVKRMNFSGKCSRKPMAEPHVRVLQFPSHFSVDEESSKPKAKIIKDSHQVDQISMSPIGKSLNAQARSRQTVVMADDEDPKLNSRVEVRVSRCGDEKITTPVKVVDNMDVEDSGPLPIPRHRTEKSASMSQEAVKTLTVMEGNSPTMSSGVHKNSTDSEHKVKKKNSSNSNGVKSLGVSTKSVKVMKPKKSKKKDVVKMDRKMFDTFCKAMKDAGVAFGLENSGDDNISERVDVEGLNDSDHDDDEQRRFLLDLNTPSGRHEKKSVSAEKTLTSMLKKSKKEKVSHRKSGSKTSDQVFATPGANNEASQKPQTAGSSKALPGKLNKHTDVMSCDKLKKTSGAIKNPAVDDNAISDNKRSPSADKARSLVKKVKLNQSTERSVKKSMHKVHRVTPDLKSAAVSSRDSSTESLHRASASNNSADISNALCNADVQSSNVTSHKKNPKLSLVNMFDSVNCGSKSKPGKAQDSVNSTQSSSQQSIAKPSTKSGHSQSNKTSKSGQKPSESEHSKTSTDQNHMAGKKSVKSSASDTTVPYSDGGGNVLKKFAKTKMQSKAVQPTDIKKTKPSPRSQIQVDFEEIFGDDSPPKPKEKSEKSSLPSKTRTSPRKKEQSKQMSSSIVPQTKSPRRASPTCRTPRKEAQTKKTQKKNVQSKEQASSKTKKKLMKVKVPLKKVSNVRETVSSFNVEPGDSTPTVYSDSPQLTPEPHLTPDNFFPMDISSDKSVREEGDEDGNMTFDAAEILVSMAMNFTPQKSFSASNSSSGFPYNVYTTPQKHGGLDMNSDFLPDLVVPSTSMSQPVFPTSTERVTSGDIAASSFNATTNETFKTPEKMHTTGTTRKTPRKGTPRKLMLHATNQDPLSDLKKKDRDIFEKKVQEHPLKVKQSKKPSVKRLSPRKERKHAYW